MYEYRALIEVWDELKAEMEAIQQQMVEAKKNERANALKEVKRLCKEFGFTAGMLKGSLAEGRKTKGPSLWESLFSQVAKHDMFTFEKRWRVTRV